MALRVRDLGAAAARFAQRGAAAAQDYTNGVANAGPAWERATVDASDNYAQGVTAAIGRDAFSKGVKKSGGTYFQQRAATIGGSRFASGIQAGKDNWAEGFKPFADTLANITLPPKGPKGAPQNMQRSEAVAMALRRAKTGE